jgi:Leucine-rich repeat (LRR) protein
MMRFVALLIAGCLTTFTHAEQPTETRVISHLEKLGATVKVDEEAPSSARLRVSFARLDDLNSIKLRDLTQLISLTIEDASRCTDKTMITIGTLKNLHELNLWRPNISNSGLTNLKSLKELHAVTLSECKVGDSGVAVLKDNSKIEVLDLSGSAITNAAGLTFKTLSNLKSLTVSKTKFGDSGLALLKDLKNLKEVQATNTDVSVKAAQTLEAAISGIRIRR